MLLHDPVTACPHFSGEAVLPPQIAEAATVVPIPSLEEAARTFSSGLEMGLDEVDQRMRASYTHVVGLFGFYDAGKTSLLISLYLRSVAALLSSRFSFAGSNTISGFEQRAVRVRQWSKGALPDQLADHTSGDQRQAAFLHVALMDHEDGDMRKHLLLNDVPGEWTKKLVDSSQSAARWDFIQRADTVLIVLDGPLYAGSAKHVELQRSQHLLERLSEVLALRKSIPIAFVVSKSDLINGIVPPLIHELKNYAESLGFRPSIFQCVAFSSNPEVVQSGAGLEELVKFVFDSPELKPSESPRKTNSDRFFQRFGMVD